LTRTALQCKICSVVVIRNTIDHLRKAHEFDIRHGQSNRSKDVRKALQKNYFTITQAEDKKLPTKCQNCGGEIGLFRYGHTPDEHFCSSKCQMEVKK